MIIPVNLAGGGSSGSDDVTATAAQVLSPYTAITSESEDEPQMGTMADYAGTTQAASGSLDTSNQRYQLTIPNDGRYTTGSKIYQTYANARSTIGYTDASKVLSGTTFLGLAGTMADYSGTSTAATSSTSGSNVRLKIPNNGYYNTSAYLTNSYSNMASTIGLTAAKIKYGETILGITGTWNGYVATSTDLYYGGSLGMSSSVSTYTTDTSTAVTDSSCIRLAQTGSSGTNTVARAACSFSTGVNCGAYSKVTLTYNVASAAASENAYASGNRYFGFGLFTSRPTSSSACDLANADYYVCASGSDMTSTGSKTLSISLSNISSTLYVAAILRTNSTASSYNCTMEITRIQFS